jgi:hypothetical protein
LLKNEKVRDFIGTQKMPETPKTCSVILGKQSKRRGKPCGRLLPCTYHSSQHLEKPRELIINGVILDFAD